MIYLDTEKGKFAFIQVDKRARNPQILNNEFSCEYRQSDGADMQKQSLHLPTGVFRFICFSDSITEDEAEQIVEKDGKYYKSCGSSNATKYLLARLCILNMLAENRLTHNYAILKVICLI